MNKIFKNKIFYILIFSALFILALNCNSFASTEFTTPTDKKIVLSDYLSSFKSYCIVYYKHGVAGNSNNNLLFLGTNSPRLCFSSEYGGVVAPVNADGSMGESTYSCVYYDNASTMRGFPSWNDMSKITADTELALGGLEYKPGYFNGSNISGLLSNPDNIYFIYSNCDINRYSIKDKVISNETVFQGAPRTQVEPLTEITQVEEIQPVVAKIVGLVLPACLTIFGTLLVLYLIKSKNLLQL